MFDDKKIIEYVVMNPSNNITILVISDVEDECDYWVLAKRLLGLEPTAEQVGFLQYDDESDIILNMAGGEFCGNATMSAAVYYGILHDVNNGNVVVKSSGANELVNVHIKKNNEWEGIVEMPKPLEICEVDFENGESYPVVFFKGIAHVIVDRKVIACGNDGEKKLLDDDKSFDNNKILISDSLKKEFENKIKEWCKCLEIEALGIMFCDFGDLKFDSTNNSKSFVPMEVLMTPFVYVKSIDTLYWESSCASGTTAVGEYLLDMTNSKDKINVRQPSGTILSVEKTTDGKLLLTGKVKLLYKKSIMI